MLSVVSFILRPDCTRQSPDGLSETGWVYVNMQHSDKPACGPNAQQSRNCIKHVWTGKGEKRTCTNS